MMRKRIVSVLILSVTLMLSIGYSGVMAAKPPSTTLVATIAGPADGLEVDSGGSFVVSGTVMSTKGDAGVVDTYVQCAVGEGSVDFKNVEGSGFQLLSGMQPQSQTLLNGQSYDVCWTLTGRPGTYEVRIYSMGATAKSGASVARTVTILSPPLPAGVEAVDSEYQDSAVGYGSAVGSYKETCYADRAYEILSEGRNTQGTKKPGDDMTELGWIFEFQLSTAPATMTFCFYGYAEFTSSDTDTSFLVQQESSSGWQTIMEISHTGVSRLLSADLTGSASSTVKLRIIDNDRTLGNTGTSSLHIDQAYIGIDGYVPPTSGIEILVGPYSGGLFQAWANYGADWYHDADVGISTAIATDIVFIDMDHDGRNEVVVSEGYSQELGNGIVEIFDFDTGTSPIHTLVAPSGIDGAIMCIAAGDFDNDSDIEILGGSFSDGAVVWDMVNGAYQPVIILRGSGAVDTLAAGDLDGDAVSELVLAVGFPDHSFVAVYKYYGGSWGCVANYSDFSAPGRFFGKVEVDDVNGDGLREVIVDYYDDPLRVLCYRGDALVNLWTSSVLPGRTFVTGDATNDGSVDIIVSNRAWKEPPGILMFEYIDGTFVNTFNITVPDMEAAFGNQMAIGDIDADGLNEFVVVPGGGGVYSVGDMYIFRNDTLILRTELGATDGSCVAIGDYDNDRP